MGFPHDKAKKAIDSSKSNVLNDLIDLIIKDLSESASSEPALQKKGTEKNEYVPYSCEVCTLINEKNPGPFCMACESPAPAHALKVVKTEAQTAISMEAKPKTEGTDGAAESTDEATKKINQEELAEK